ncbi:MAG: hypothetical protein LC808_31235 [Actinobacteria bacterium]|nr:hypothetical protein [Actinomycetota bacterium]
MAECFAISHAFYRAFMEQTRPHRLFAVVARVAEILSEIVEDPAAVEDYCEELVCLRPWLLTERIRYIGRAGLGVRSRTSARLDHAASHGLSRSPNSEAN